MNLQCLDRHCAVIDKQDVVHFFDELAAGWDRDLSGWLRPGGRLTVAHSMSIAQLNRHHAGRAARVSMGMLPAAELAELFSPWFDVDTAISDQEKYILSGTRKMS